MFFKVIEYGPLVVAGVLFHDAGFDVLKVPQNFLRAWFVLDVAAHLRGVWLGFGAVHCSAISISSLAKPIGVALLSDFGNSFFPFFGRFPCWFFGGLPIVCVMAIKFGVSAGNLFLCMPAIYSHVGFLHWCPYQLCSTYIENPFHLSISFPIGRSISPHSVLWAGCSKTPPHVRTCSIAQIARYFSSFGALESPRIRDHARHGGCAIIGLPPGHVIALRDIPQVLPGVRVS